MSQISGGDQDGRSPSRPRQNSAYSNLSIEPAAPPFQGGLGWHLTCDILSAQRPAALPHRERSLFLHGNQHLPTQIKLRSPPASPNQAQRKLAACAPAAALIPKRTVLSGAGMHTNSARHLKAKHQSAQKRRVDLGLWASTAGASWAASFGQQVLPCGTSRQATQRSSRVSLPQA